MSARRMSVPLVIGGVGAELLRPRFALMARTYTRPATPPRSSRKPTRAEIMIRILPESDDRLMSPADRRSFRVCGRDGLCRSRTESPRDALGADVVGRDQGDEPLDG